MTIAIDLRATSFISPTDVADFLCASIADKPAPDAVKFEFGPIDVYLMYDICPGEPWKCMLNLECKGAWYLMGLRLALEICHYLQPKIGGYFFAAYDTGSAIFSLGDRGLVIGENCHKTFFSPEFNHPFDFEKYCNLPHLPLDFLQLTRGSGANDDLLLFAEHKEGSGLLQALDWTTIPIDNSKLQRRIGLIEISWSEQIQSAVSPAMMFGQYLVIRLRNPKAIHSKFHSFWNDILMDYALALCRDVQQGSDVRGVRFFAVNGAGKPVFFAERDGSLLIDNSARDFFTKFQMPPFSNILVEKIPNVGEDNWATQISG